MGSEEESRTPVAKRSTQDDPTGRAWTWEEDGYTVIRSNARSGPGCHDNCGVLMYVKDGVLEKIEGDPENPYNQGRLCPRCLAFKEMLYHEDRLRYPMKRAKEDRGKNTFERVSWEEAYDIIEREMKKVIEAYGPEAIWVTQGTGRDINGYGPLMAQYFGTPNYGTGFLSGQACYAPRIFSTALKAGGLFICDYSQFFPDRYDDPRWTPPEYVLIWGNNPVVANSDGTLGHWIVESMKRGSKLIVMDPMLTWVAGKADVFLQVRPGTDAALALALCNVIIEEGLEDKEFVDLWCYGYDEFKEHVKKYTAAFAAETCGVDEELDRGGRAQDRQGQVGVPAVGRCHGPHVGRLHHRHGVLRPHGAHGQLRKARHHGGRQPRVGHERDVDAAREGVGRMLRTGQGPGPHHELQVPRACVHGCHQP